MSATAERTRDSDSENRPTTGRSIREGCVELRPGADGVRPGISQVRWNDRTIELKSESLFGNDAGKDPELRRRTFGLIERLFRHESLRSLECDRKGGRLILRLFDDSAETLEVMRQLCRNLISENETPHQAPVLLRQEAPAESFELHRYGRLLTSWRILERGPESLTLELPRFEISSQRIELARDAIAHVEGVSDVLADSRLGQLRVEAISGRPFDEEELLRTLERLEGQDPLSLADRRFPRADLRLPAIAVGLAATAQWVSPMTWPLAAALIVWLNLPMLRRGIAELRKGILGLPILTVLIVTGTLIGGALFAAALMTLTSRFWQNRYFAMLALAQSEWLGQLSLVEGTAVRCLPLGNFEVVRVDRIRPGDVIEIKAPESIPADGDWIDGEGEVVQAFGETVVGRVSEGDVTFRLYAGGWLREGKIRMRVSATGENTRARRVRHEILKSTGVLKGKSTVNEHGESFAEKTVVPSLALAGLGLATAGLSEAVAVLRPDYGMAVGIGEGLERLKLGAEALHEGFLVRDSAKVAHLRSIDLWLVEPGSLDDRSRDRILRSAAIAEIRSPSWIELTTIQGNTTLRGFAGLNDDSGRERLLKALRSSGVRKIGWIGDAEAFPRTASAVDIAFSSNTDFESAHPAAAVVNLVSGRDPNWGRIFELLEVTGSESRGLRLRALAPNVAAVSGALFMGFDSLAAVILTNFGIFSVHRKVRNSDIAAKRNGIDRGEAKPFERNGHA